ELRRAQVVRHEDRGEQREAGEEQELLLERVLAQLRQREAEQRAGRRLRDVARHVVERPREILLRRREWIATRRRIARRLLRRRRIARLLRRRRISLRLLLRRLRLREARLLRPRLRHTRGRRLRLRRHRRTHDRRRVTEHRLGRTAAAGGRSRG